MRYSAIDERIGPGPEAVQGGWPLLVTTYVMIISAVMLMAVSEQTMLYALMALLLCGGHALIVGPGGRPPLSATASKALALAALGFGLFQAQFTSVHLSFALAHFLLAIQFIKLYSPHRARDQRLIQVAAIFQTMVAGIWAMSVVYLPLFIVLVLALMANSALLAACEGEGRPEAPPAPAGPGLWRGLAASLWPPAGMVFVAMALAFVALPRHRTYEGRARYAVPIRVTGFSENVSLREVGRMRTSEDVVLRVKFLDNEEPGDPPIMPPRLLLRGLSLPVYRRGQWFETKAAFRHMRDGQRVERQQGQQADFTSRSVYVLEDALVERRRIRQQVTVTARPVRTRFALYRPIVVEGVPAYRTMVDFPSHHIIAPNPARPGETYEVVSLVPLFTDQQLREAGTPESAGQWTPFFWDVPPGIRDVLEERAAEIERLYPERARRSDYDRVKAVESYLLEGGRFEYTFQLPDFGDMDPVSAFLTETRSGSCEQFSTAMALILRVWGIPTRLAIGYKGGQYSPVSQTFTIRDSNAHAWVEVYFNELGWVEFDPTPGIEVGGAQDEGIAGDVDSLLDGVKYALRRLYFSAEAAWGANVVGYTKRRQRQLIEGLHGAAANLAEQATSIFRALWPGMPSFGLLQVGLLIVLLTSLSMGVYLGAQWLQARLAPALSRRGADRTLPFYRQFLSLMRRKGLPRPDHATPREFARSVLARLSVERGEERQVEAAVELVTELYYRVRFGGYELTPEQARSLQRALKLIASARIARHQAPARPAGG